MYRIILAVLGCACVVGLVRADKIELIAGGSGPAGSAATQAKLIHPFGVDRDRAGNLYLVELKGERVLKIDVKGILHQIGGTGEKGSSGDGGPAVKAQFNGMHSLAVAPNGDIYLADTWNNRVRRLDPRTGMIHAFAGTGEKGFSGDGGPAAKAQFGGIYCIAFDSHGEKLYLADLDNRRIRSIDMKTGTVDTVAGNGKKGMPADGSSAKTEPLVDPRAVAVDSKDNVYILERSGHALRVVDPQGKIRTVVGTGKPGNTGDNDDAKMATMKGPKHLCIDRDDNVIIADTDNHVIRKYSPKDGKIIRIAGVGKTGTGGVGGTPEQIELNQPHGVFVDPSGTLYIVDSLNNRLLKVVK